MEVALVMCWKAKKDTSTVFVDLEILEIASTFGYEGDFDCAFGDVGSSSNWRGVDSGQR